MDLISILATVILVTTIATTVVGIGAYAAFKLRDKRQPTKRAESYTYILSIHKNLLLPSKA